VNRSDEFRRNAAECQRMADKTADEGDKRAWLRLAESWLRLIRPIMPGTEKRTPAEQFDTQEKTQGTRQTPSSGSH
jgi:hypothetical protein